MSPLQIQNISYSSSDILNVRASGFSSSCFSSFGPDSISSRTLNSFKHLPIFCVKLYQSPNPDSPSTSSCSVTLERSSFSLYIWIPSLSSESLREICREISMAVLLSVCPAAGRKRSNLEFSSSAAGIFFSPASFLGDDD